MQAPLRIFSALAFTGILLTGAGCATTSTTTPAPAPAKVTTFRELGVAQVHDGLASGRFRVRDLERYYHQRIDALDVHGPALRAVIELNPEAPLDAARLDDAGTNVRRGPLYGVPVLVKDNIDTAGAMHTTAGSLALVDSRPAQDAFVVQRLRAAGALILGKTNLSEWANIRSTRSSSGWSGVGGQTRNPYATDRSACGSSSGSGAAIAADFAVVAVGTETDGSIVCPSSVNGLVGLKPTVGLVSRAGVIPISASQDTPGPMARTVADAAALLTVLAGYDPADPATAPLRERPPVDYTLALDAASLKGARIGVLRESAGFHEGVDAVFEQALAALRAAGAVLVDPVAVPNQNKLDADELSGMLYELKDGMNHYLATRLGPGPRTLAEVIAWNEQHRDAELAWFQQELFLDAQAKGPLTTPEFVTIHERLRRLAGPEGIDAALAANHLDALVGPSMGLAWTIDQVNGDHFTGGGVGTLPAIAGYPHITVPMGAVHGLPVGLSFVSTAWTEARLIGYAYAFEQATHARVPPALAEPAAH